MIKKIIIWGLVVFAAYFFYKKFVSPTAEPFFKENKGKVDFLGITSPTLDMLPKIKEPGN